MKKTPSAREVELCRRFCPKAILDQPGTRCRDDILAALANSHTGDRTQMATDLDAFLAQLDKAGLLAAD